MFFKWADPSSRQSFAILSYVKGIITEPLTRILKRHDIQVFNKPTKTPQQDFSVPKFRPLEDNHCNVISKIPCASCEWIYIVETKRSFRTRRKEHIRNTRQCAKGSNVAKHAWTPTVCVGTQQKLVRVIISHAHSRDNITFCETNINFSTFSFPNIFEMFYVSLANNCSR